MEMEIPRPTGLYYCQIMIMEFEGRNSGSVCDSWRFRTPDRLYALQVNFLHFTETLREEVMLRLEKLRLHRKA